MSSGATFREWIDDNKRKVLKYLEDKGFQSTYKIQQNYGGEKDIYQVRKALKELKSEGLVEDRIVGLNSKDWRIVNAT